jgi:hypothetical protein
MDLYVEGGWISLPGADGAVLHVRVSGRDDQVVITDLFIHSPDGITSTAVRGLSISRLEAELNAAIHCEPVSEATELGMAADFARGAGDDAPEPTLAELRTRMPITRAERPAQRPRLTRPGGADPDEFYPLVAQAYWEYAPLTRAPAKEIATEAGVPITTVHRWIREARRRGFLSSAKKGKAG